jgi:hypothetical protein
MRKNKRRKYHKKQKRRLRALSSERKVKKHVERSRRVIRPYVGNKIKGTLCLFLLILDLYTMSLCSEINTTTYNGNPNIISNEYTDAEVQELSSFIRELGIDIPAIQTTITKQNISALGSDGEEYSPCAWTTSDGKVFIHPECSDSYCVIGHEMAHQVLFEKYPELTGDHHSLLVFKQWEFCLAASAKFHTNLCKIMVE